MENDIKNLHVLFPRLWVSHPILPSSHPSTPHSSLARFSDSAVGILAPQMAWWGGAPGTSTYARGVSESLHMTWPSKTDDESWNASISCNFIYRPELACTLFWIKQPPKRFCISCFHTFTQDLFTHQKPITPSPSCTKNIFRQPSFTQRSFGHQQLQRNLSTTETKETPSALEALSP